MTKQKTVKDVQNFWEEASCGEALYLNEETVKGYAAQLEERYRLEPYIPSFANFSAYKNQKVLEIGLGLGADHQMFARAGADLYGVDLTKRAVEHVKNRFKNLNLQSKVKQENAEKLTFENESFDLVYSWGVLHHSPNTEQCLKEVYRVLKVGGEAKVMVYHKYSIVGLMLWLRYGLLKGRPFTSLEEIYSDYLESPGTKAYTVKEMTHILENIGFKDIQIHTVLTHADLLESNAGQRHRGGLLSLAKKVWPRWLFKACCPKCGLFMMIKAKK